MQGQLLSLPAELLEWILTHCAGSRHPLSVAALAQVCRQLRALVYDAPDHHLWRALFLTTFDDPRSLSRSGNDVDWQHDFTERIWAANVLRQTARPLSVSAKKRALRSTSSMMYLIDKFPTEDADPDSHARLLTALLSVVRTARPFSGRQIPSPTDDGVENATSPELTRAHARMPTYPPSSHDQTPSLNISWLKEILTHGLPFALIRMLSDRALDWSSMPDGQALCQLTAYLGFLPIPIVDTEADDAPPPSASPHRRRAGKSPTRPRSDPTTEVLDMSETAQRARARATARPHAFAMRYLSRRRHWGPYVAISRRRADERSAGPRVPDATAEEESIEDSDSDSDADYVPPDDGSTSSTTPEPAPAPAPVSTSTLPTAEQLRPDWTWLAAARIVAECKLRQHVDAEDIATLEDWDNLREGAWRLPERSEGGSDEVREDSASRETSDEWRKHERDWAGAEGVWRRLVCWLDYDDLVYHNSYGAFRDPDLDEAWIIVPMSLRITGYSAPSLPHLHPDRPTIHVEGEMGGAGWVGSVDANDDDIRRVHGTVSMLLDGSVRWSITSTAPGSSADEWASEAVQLGGVRSAMGALGMWTGASHEDGDPLGVFWQWRVG